MGKRLVLNDVCFALREESGLLTRAAVRLGCSRKGLYLFIQRHTKALEVLHDARERLIDDAEAGLRKAVQDGDMRAIFFVLKVLDGKRGFKESWLRDPLYTDPNDPEYMEPGPRRRRIDDLEDEDWSTPEVVEPEPDWAAREAELIQCFQEERQSLLARIRELEASPPVVLTRGPEPDGEDAEVMAELQRLARLAEDLQRRVGGPS
jgi:hypothetical protein